jgi:hypothetical protein
MLGWVKEHPYLTGGIALAVIVLIILFRGSSSSNAAASQTSSGTSDTQAVAALNANAAIQQMAYASQTQVAGFNEAANVAAINAAAETSIANNQTAGAVQLGLAQSNNAVATASIAAGGITPFSVAGTPGYNASIVGNSQVQAMNAGYAADENTGIAAVSNTIANHAVTGTALPSQQPAPIPSNPVSSGPVATYTPYTPSTPTSIGTGIAPGLPSPANYATEADYVAAVDLSGGVNPATAGLSSSLSNAPTIETLGNEAAAAWSAYFGPGGISSQHTNG